MKGTIKGNTIILEESLPHNIGEGDRVEVIIQPIGKEDFPFPIFPLSIKEEALLRENIYYHFLRDVVPNPRANPGWL